ncbi:MAG: bifunctional glutamate N-acetyltransferase/amino-acid acetyltransferase ArgJ [Desulfovibrionaceae bacterium]|nr:bifunctional glutamate N-acetyltransferase/amino-acid acetyltransferase ArgJ [Desulfovibrionaceae bacterium]
MRDDLPKGFRAGSAAAGFKQAGRQDLGLIVSDEPCVLAALFTQNRFCAAPVTVCRKILAEGLPVRAVVANSGQANACTGTEGLANVATCQKMVAEHFGLAVNEVLPLSTGVIGQQLKMDKWQVAMPELVASVGSRDAEGFTRAIMTTDAFPKFDAQELDLSEGRVRLTVMAKGAGMICPNMATMLCVCLTDAAILREPWQEMFARAVEKTFNRVSVDGDTSTNDTILGLANGAAKVHATSSADLQILEEALTGILARVSHMLVKDGEGASKVIHLEVFGANTPKDAELVARSVGNSQLVKTAIYGGDANWGRIITAVGYSGANFDPEKVSLKLCGIERFRQGQPVNDDQEEELANLLQSKDIAVEINLGSGQCSYTLETSDLGHEYVSLNSDYRS